MNFKSPWVTYIGMAIAILAAVAGIYEKTWADIAWMIAGLAGFGSIASLRAYFESKGWKTYVLAIGGGITSVLVGFGIIDMAAYEGIMALIAALTGVTLQQAATKVSLAK